MSDRPTPHDEDYPWSSQILSRKIAEKFDAAVPATTDRIADVLARHWSRHLQAADSPNGLVWKCCGAVVGPYELDGDELETAHRAHVAAVLADLFGDAQADAWEAGRRVERDAWFGRATNENLRNPYRRGIDDGEDA